MMKKRNDPGEEAFLRVLRPLVETYSAVMRKDDHHIRKLGLTQAQFDVIRKACPAIRLRKRRY